LCGAQSGLPIIQKNREDFGEGKAMGTFEEFGQVMDKELEKLRRFFQSEVKPTTLRSAADALRATSGRLARMAEELEERLKQTEAGKP
jgi:hypothetical protein